MSRGKVGVGVFAIRLLRMAEADKRRLSLGRTGTLVHGVFVPSRSFSRLAPSVARQLSRRGPTTNEHPLDVCTWLSFILVTFTMY